AGPPTTYLGDRSPAPELSDGLAVGVRKSRIPAKPVRSSHRSPPARHKTSRADVATVVITPSGCWPFSCLRLLGPGLITSRQTGAYARRPTEPGALPSLPLRVSDSAADKA